MAGASLLQLASATAQGSSPGSVAGTGQNTAVGSPPPPQPPSLKSEESAEGSSNPRFGGTPPESGRAQRRMSVQAYSAVVERPLVRAPRRRATYNEPLESGMNTLVPGGLQQDQTRRRATLSLPAPPLLPSVQSLLEDIPMVRVKRQREEGEDGSYEMMDVNATSSLLRSPPVPTQDPASLSPAAAVAVGISGGSETKRGVATTAPAAVGAGDRREEAGSTPGSPAMSDASSHGSAAVTAATPAGASGHSRPPTKAARLFSRSASGRGEGQQDGGWASRRKVWNPLPSPATTGYVTSSPAPDWRRHGLESMRTASFDEARLAASKHGLDGARQQDASTPRRASAFVSHGSALPPKVAEINRRTSALERSSTGAAPGRVPHYSDLLSARAPSRSLTAFNSFASHSPMVTLGNPDARIEEEGSDPAVPGDVGSATGNGSAPGAGGGAGHGGGNGAPARIPPTASRAAPMFHVMPATAPFISDLKPSSPHDNAGAAPRRWSVLDSGSRGPSDNEAGGTMFAPAWGESAPAEEGGAGGDGDAAAAATATEKSDGGSSRRAAVMDGPAVGSNAMGGHAGGNQPSGRSPRRGSMMAPPAPAPAGRQAAQSRPWPAAAAAAAADPSDHGRAESNMLAPAWGAPSEEEPAKEPKASAAPAGRGVAERGGRAKALFGGGGGEGRSRSVLTGGTRRWSVVDTTSPPLDLRGAQPPTNAFGRPSWGEATEERVAAEAAAEAEQPSRSPVRQNAGSGAGGNSRRGSMVAAGSNGRGFSTLFHGSSSVGAFEPNEGTSAPGSMGPSMAMLPPAPRRGSVISHGPAMPSSQRRGSVTGMDEPPSASSAKGMSAGWQGVQRQRDFMDPTSQGSAQ